MNTDRRLNISLVVVSTVASLTWPYVLGARALSIAEKYPFAAQASARFGYLVVAATAGLLSTWVVRRHRPTTLSWTAYGAAGGAFVAITLLAAASFFRRDNSVGAFLETFVGGIPWAGPPGAVVGALVGVAMGATVALTRSERFRSSRSVIAILLGTLCLHVVFGIILSRVLSVDWLVSIPIRPSIAA